MIETPKETPKKEHKAIAHISLFRKLSRSLSPAKKKKKQCTRYKSEEMIDKCDYSTSTSSQERSTTSPPSYPYDENLPDHEMIEITCYWEKESKKISVNRSIPVEELLKVISEAFDSPVKIGEIKFTDEVKDLITISKSRDLVECFSRENCEIHITKQDARSRSVPEEYLFSIFDGNESDSENANPVVCPSASLSPNMSIPKNSKMPSCHSMAYRQSLKENEKAFRRTRTTTDSPYESALIDPLELIIPDYRPIGKGFFSEVRIGFLHGEIVACKKLLGKSFKNKSENDLFMREISILSELRHPNVIEYRGTCIFSHSKVIVMEFMECGNLYDLLRSKQLDFHNDFKVLVRIAKDTAEGMKFLHDNKIIHRDLNSKNILLTKGLRAKVADFGLSRKKLELDTTLSYTMGQIPWMAPEVLRNSKHFTIKADVYSFGILTWQLVTRESPCPDGVSHVNMASMVMNDNWRPPIPTNVCSKWASLIQTCWDASTEKRPTFPEIVILLAQIAPITDVDISINVPSLARLPTQESVYIDGMEIESVDPY